MVAELHPTSSTRNDDLLTAEEYFASCHAERSELINGEVIELMPPGFQHGEIAVTIASFLKNFVRGKSLGRVSVEGGFVLQRNPTIVRSPDVSFVEMSRLEGGKSPQSFIEGAPTIAVEIVSPGDLWQEVEDKTRLYLDKGATQVWIVEPDSQTITIRTQNTVQVLDKHQTLENIDVLPNFQMPLAEVFED